MYQTIKYKSTKDSINGEEESIKPISQNRITP